MAQGRESTGSFIHHLLGKKFFLTVNGRVGEMSLFLQLVFQEMEQTIRYRKKVEKDEMYVNTIVQLG